MIQKIKNYLILVTAAVTLTGLALAPAVVSADASGCNAVAGQVANGANAAVDNGSAAINCQTPGTSGTDAISQVAAKAVNIFSIIVGAAAVIMIIYAGFRYITSGGSSERVGGAKNSLIYAVIGLVIVAIAQLIVHYVLFQANSLGT